MNGECKPLTCWWWCCLGGTDVSGLCCHHQLCSFPVSLFPGGLQSLCALGWGAVGVSGGGDVLSMSCGDFQSLCAGFCLQGGDVGGVSHLSWRPLSLAGWRPMSWLCYTGLLGKGGGCGWRHRVQNAGLCEWLWSRAAGGATELGGWGCREGRRSDSGGGGGGFESFFLSYMRPVKEKIDRSKLTRTENYFPPHNTG